MAECMEAWVVEWEDLDQAVMEVGCTETVHMEVGCMEEWVAWDLVKIRASLRASVRVHKQHSRL